MSVSRRMALLVALALTAACQSTQSRPMSDSASRQVDTEIRAAANAVIDGFNQGDVGPYLDQLSNVQSYAENQMVFPSGDSVRSAVNQFKSSGMSVKIEWTGQPKVVVLAPDLGVFTSTMRETVTDANGGTTVQAGAWTAVYRQIDGSWKIVAAHESYGPVPGDEGT